MHYYDEIQEEERWQYFSNDEKRFAESLLEDHGKVVPQSETYFSNDEIRLTVK